MEAVIGAAVGGALALIGALTTTVLSNRSQVTLQRLRADEARSKEARARTQAVLQQMMSAAHSMHWIGWFAWADKAVQDDDSARYHAEVHETFPALLGGLATLAADDPDLHGGLERMASDLFEIDTQIAQALLLRVSDPERSKQELLAGYNRALEFTGSAPRRYARLVEPVSAHT